MDGVFLVSSNQFSVKPGTGTPKLAFLMDGNAETTSFPCKGLELSSH